MAANGLDQHRDVSFQVDANVNSDQGEQLQGRLTTPWVQQGAEPEAVLPTPVTHTAFSSAPG